MSTWLFCNNHGCLSLIVVGDQIQSQVLSASTLREAGRTSRAERCCFQRQEETQWCPKSRLAAVTRTVGTLVAQCALVSGLPASGWSTQTQAVYAPRMPATAPPATLTKQRPETYNREIRSKVVTRRHSLSPTVCVCVLFHPPNLLIRKLWHRCLVHLQRVLVNVENPVERLIYNPRSCSSSSF